jgi:hypothetical protein
MVRAIVVEKFDFQAVYFNLHGVESTTRKGKVILN